MNTTALRSLRITRHFDASAERVFDFRPPALAKWHVLLRGDIGATAEQYARDLATTQRFFAGGDRSVRGFDLNELSPRDENDDSIGGKHLATGTVEVTRDLPRNFGVATFFDYGNAFNHFGDPLEYAAGVGFRLRLPVVTLGVDVAQPLSTSAGPRLHINFSPKL